MVKLPSFPEVTAVEEPLTCTVTLDKGSPDSLMTLPVKTRPCCQYLKGLLKGDAEIVECAKRVTPIASNAIFIAEPFLRCELDCLQMTTQTSNQFTKSRITGPRKQWHLFAK